MLKSRLAMVTGATLVCAVCVPASLATATTEPPDGSATTAAGSGVDLPVGTYQLGFEAILTGSGAFAGIPMANAVEIAVDEINETEFLGAGAVLEVQREDGSGDQATVVNIGNQFVGDDSILGVLCCVFSSTTGAVKPLLDGAGLPSVVISAVLPSATEGDFMFRSRPDPAPIKRESVHVTHHAFGYETAVVAVTGDNDGMVAEGDLYAEELQSLGVEVLDTVEAFEADTDYSGPATQIAAAEPDVVFISMLGNQIPLLVRDLRERGYEGEIVTNEATQNRDSFDVAGDAIVGTVFPVAFFAGNDTPETQQFVERYETEFDIAPDEFASMAYNAVWMLARGLRAGGEGTREALAEGLASIRSMPSSMGELTFDEDGQASIAEVSYLQWNAEGELVLWDETAEGRLDW